VENRRCGMDDTVGSDGRPVRDTSTDHIVVCRGRGANNTCNYHVEEENCATQNKSCQNTLDGPRCAAPGEPPPQSRDGKSCNVDDDCPRPCGCYVANDGLKFCRYINQDESPGAACYGPEFVGERMPL